MKQQQQQQQIIITIMQILAPTYRTFGISSSKKLFLNENCHSIYFIPQSGFRISDENDRDTVPRIRIST